MQRRFASVRTESQSFEAMESPKAQDPSRRGRIQHRLMAWGLSLLAVALLINTFAGSLYTRHKLREDTERLQTEVALFAANRMQTVLARRVERLEDASAVMMLSPLGGEQQRQLGRLLLKNDDSISEVAILNAEGREVLRLSAGKTNATVAQRDLKQSPEFVTAAAGHLYIRAMREAHPSRRSWVSLAVPLKAADGAIAGVLTARADLDFLRHAIGDVKFGHRGYAYVIDELGKLIAHPDPALTLIKLDLNDVPKVRQFVASHSGDFNPAAEAVGISGATVLSTYARIANLGWGIIVEEPLEAVMAGMQDIYIHAAILLASGLFAGAAVIVWFSRRITRPIQKLRDSVETIRRGDLAHRAEVQTGDEIEGLAEEFNHMTAALQQSKATLEQRVEQRTQEISALYEITAMVSQSLDIEAVLDTVIKKITALFGFDTTRVYLYDPDSDLISLRGCFEVNPETWVNISSFRRGQSVVGKVVETAQPIIFENLADDVGYREMSESHASGIAGMDFLAAFPVKTKHACYGALVFSGKTRRSLKPEEIRLLSSMAEQIGVAVENSSLYQQARSKSEHLTVLNEVAGAVSRSLDLETVLREALDTVVGILKFDAAWAYMIDREEQQLHLKAYKGLGDETVQMLDTQGARGGIIKTVVSNGRRLAMGQGVERYRAVLSSNPVRPRGYRGSIAVPIKSRENVIGVLYAVNWQSRRYTADDLRLIESVAQEIGVAIENAKLFAEIKKQSAELKKINDELRAATQAKSEFIAAMSHELRTPLNIMIGNADLTHDSIFGEINDEQKSAMRKITRNGRVLLKMINDLLKLSRLEAKRMTLDPAEIEIAEVLHHARDQVAELNRDQHLETGWNIDDHLPRIFTDPVKFEEILHNLIGNAFKFTPRGRIDISARNQPDQHRVEFSVADTGIGIDPGNLERVFEKFEQIKSPGKTKNDGVGLGLSIVKRYLDLMQGGISVESKPGQGSKFTFWLPYSIDCPSTELSAQLNGLTFQAGKS
jgi:signal transduction histidine kinase